MYVKEMKEVVGIRDIIYANAESTDKEVMKTGIVKKVEPMKNIAPIALENYLLMGKDLIAHTKEGELMTTLAAYTKNSQAIDKFLCANLDMNKFDVRG